MKSLKILGGIQVVIAVVFIIASIRTAPRTSGLTRQFAETSRKLAITTALHRDIYRKSAQNVFSLRSALLDMSSKTAATALAVRVTSKAIPKTPKFFGKLREPLQETGQSLASVSAATKEQAEILEQYEKSVFPQTIEVFDESIKSFELSAKTLDEMSDRGTNNFLILCLLAGVFFLLNGIALILIGIRPNVL